MPLINCKINLILTQSSNYVIFPAAKFAIRDARHYVPVVTLSAKDNTKLLQQLKLGFERKINWNKYQLKKPKEKQS